MLSFDITIQAKILLPNCILIGSQKSASTFLHRCLGQHPDAYSPRGEIDFFEGRHYDENRIGDLERMLDRGAGKEIVAIKQPRYLGLPECPGRIARHCPDAKILVVLRNPVERALSAYYHYISYGLLPVVNVEKGMLDILNKRFCASYAAANEVIEFGYYHRHLKRYLDYFDRSQIHITIFDDLKKDPRAAVENIYRYLKIRHDYVPRALSSNPQQVVYSPVRLRLLAFRNFFYFRWSYVDSRPYLKSRTLLGSAINKSVLLLDHSLLEPFVDNRKPQLSKSLMSRLFQTYDEDVSNLERLLGRDLGSWRGLHAAHVSQG